MKNLLLLISLIFLIHSGVFSQQTNRTSDAKNQAKQKLQGIVDRLNKGENFTTLAILYSDDSNSAPNGGCHDSLKRGFFLPAFDAVAFNLKPGEISTIFETLFGYEIVLCRAKRGEEIDACHILIRPK